MFRYFLTLFSLESFRNNNIKTYKMFHGVQISSLTINSCRVCLKTVDKSGVTLDENSDLLKLFKFCTDLATLPQEKAKMLCGKCSNKVKSYAKFKRNCFEANEIWKSIEIQNVKWCTEDSSQLGQVKAEVLEEDGILLDSCDIDDTFCLDENPLIDVKYEPEKRRQQLTVKNLSHKHTKIKKSISKVKKLSKAKAVNKPKVPVKKIVTSYCGLCNYSPENNDDNREHLSTHWTSSDFKCHVCDLTGQDAAYLLTHRYTHYPEGRTMKFYTCHICNKKCASTLSLEFHYRSVHLQKPGGFCSQCRKSFSIYNTWKKHYRLHNNERFICDHCGKKFLYRHQIEGHLIDHGNTRNYICEACGKGFKRKFGLKTHMESVHSSEAIKCTHCNKMFKSQITYKDHMKVVNAKKPFICVLCGKTYHLESALRSHMFWHSGEKPHICDVCGLRYKSKGQLKVHKRNHTGYMPFKCKECDKCFTSSQPLKRHQSVHTGKRAHRCTHCDRTFHGKKMMLEHCASSHKEINVKLETTSL